MIMKKKLITMILVTGLAATAVFGCGNAQTEETSKQETSGQTETQDEAEP